jgi:alkaline phosphatase D
MRQNRPPTEGMQYFGLARVDGETEVLRVSLHDLAGRELYRVDLDPDLG